MLSSASHFLLSDKQPLEPRSYCCDMKLSNTKKAQHLPNKKSKTKSVSINGIKYKSTAKYIHNNKHASWRFRRAMVVAHAGISLRAEIVNMRNEDRCFTSP